MNRIDNIKNFAQKKELEEKNKKELKQKNIERYKQNIKELKPRIDELIEVGNACLQYNIPLTGKAFGGRESYETNQFITNGWSHLLGFVTEINPINNSKYFDKLGIFGGGACNYNLTTNGEKIEVSGNIEYVLTRFIEEFDEFEIKFYEYVDKITNNQEV